MNLWKNGRLSSFGYENLQMLKNDSREYLDFNKRLISSIERRRHMKDIVESLTNIFAKIQEPLDMPLSVYID